MNAGHFSYLLADNRTQHTKVAADRLELLAKSAARQYIDGNAPLNKTIQKIAQENDLNSNQIERICEMANIATHQGLWPKTAQKEKIAFPLADSKVVLAACGCQDSPPMDGEIDCASSIDSDYAGPPKAIPMAGPSIASMMGVDPSSVHNGLSEEPEAKRIVIVLQKKAAERQRLADRLVCAGAELETLEKKAFEAVKQTVLGGATFRQVYEATHGVGLAKIANELLPKFQDKLIADTHGDIRSRLVKHAIAKAPDELISDNLGSTTVINGAHPVLVSLDTIQRKNGEIRNGIKNLLRIDDEVKILNQRIRELS
jgi:hypothetical protein